MDKKTQIKVFLASPMDLQNERGLFRNAVERINSTVGAEMGAELDLLCWENNTRPGVSEDAQAVVNRQLRGDYGIFVCMFKERVGTPTCRTISGTVEEYERAKLKALRDPNLEIMAYFFDTPSPRPEIAELKSRMGGDGALFWEVRQGDDFEEKVFNHLKEALCSHLARLEKKKAKQTSIPQKNASYVAFVCEDQVLMLQRASNSHYGPDMWQLPGGKSEDGEDALQTACREVKEELSYTVKSPELLVKVASFCSPTPSHPDSLLNTTLYVYKVKKKFKPKLDKESRGYEWISLEACDFKKKKFFDLNEQMLRIVWREIFATLTLRYLLAYLQQSGENLLPTSLPNVSKAELNSAYALLSLLGITEYSPKGLILRSEKYSTKLLKEVIYILANNDSIFHDDKNALPSKIKNFSYEAIEQLRSIRADSFCSNEALVAHLSCDTMIDNSVRPVCDTLIFGDYNGKKYILLRWDFLANKYQLIGKGLEKSVITDEEDKIDAVMTKRLPTIKDYFDFVFITEYEGYHFSAGSVDNDPIWRKYLIDIAVLLPNNTANTGDILKAINNTNREAQAKIEVSLKITPPQAKDMKYFVWCELAELIEKPTSYRGCRVSGFGDLLGNLGEKRMQALTDNYLTSIKLPDEPQGDDNLEQLKKIFDRKYN